MGKCAAIILNKREKGRGVGTVEVPRVAHVAHTARTQSASLSYEIGGDVVVYLKSSSGTKWYEGSGGGGEGLKSDNCITMA
jgi:hypothetical protein